MVLLSFLPFIVILLIIIAILNFFTRKLIGLEMKDNVRMLMRIISAFGLFIVAYNNRILLRGFYDHGTAPLFMNFSFYLTVAGILMLIPFFLKIKIKMWIDWLLIVPSILFLVIAVYKWATSGYTGTLYGYGEYAMDTEEVFKYLIFQFLGYLVAIYFLVIAQKRQKKLPEENGDQTTPQ